MTRRMLPLALALLGAWFPLAAAGQAVEGRVADADDAAVEGAAVLLLDDRYRTVDDDVTDGEGAYRLEAPAPGRYVVVVQLEGYANETSAPIDLSDGQTVRHDIALRGQRVGESRLAATDTLEGAALLAQAVSDACRDNFLPAMHGILFGVVVDSASSQPIPGAEAVLEFDDPSGLGGRGPLTARTDENGLYLVCDAPAGRDISVRAQAVGMVGRRKETRLRSGTMQKLDLVLAVSDPDAPGAIFGRVVEAGSGDPIPGAEVRVKDAGVGTVTNERGVFRIPRAPRGLQVVTVDHLGHAHQEQPVRILGGQAAELEVRMSVRPIEMAPMLVRVRSRNWFLDRSELEDRIANGFGFIRTVEDFEQMQPRHLAEALRGIPGVRVRQSGGAMAGEYTVQIRNAQSMDRVPCRPLIWIDGVKVGRDGSILTSVFGPDLYAVEVYRSGAETPGQFADHDRNCGVIVVWTKRGGG